MKNNQRKQVYKLFAGFLVLIYLGNLYPTLLFSVIPLAIVFTIYFYLMDIMGRHPELNTGKTKYPIFIGIKLITQYIFKSIYFNLRKSPQFIFNTIILGLPLIGVYLDWNASDFVLVCFWNIAGSYICLWLLSSFGFYGPKSFGKTIGAFFSFFFVFFIFLGFPLIGIKTFVELSPSEIFTLSLEDDAYILLGETLMCMTSIILIRILKKKDFESYEGSFEGELGNIVFGYFLLMIPALFILPFAQNYSELYAKNSTLFDIVLSCILLFFLIIKENVYFIMTENDTKKQWFAKYDEFYNTKRPIT